MVEGNEAPTLSRNGPSEYKITLNQNTTQQFRCNVQDENGNLDFVEWYLGNSMKLNDNVSGSSDSSTWSNKFTSAGTYYVHAYVYDEFDESNSVTWEIEVLPNRAPTIVRNPDVYKVEAEEGVAASFAVTVADPDFNLKFVEWYIESALQENHSVTGGSDSDSFDHTFAQAGTYHVFAYVYDQEDLEASVSWEVEVTGNTAPSISRVPDEYNKTAALNAAASFAVQVGDAEANLKFVEWYIESTLQENHPISGDSASDSFIHTFTESGTYNVFAYAYDTNDLKTMVSWQVSVTENSVPTISRFLPSSFEVHTRININDAGDPVAPSKRYFSASVTDAEDNLTHVDWYINTTYQDRTNVSESGGVASKIFEFATPGTYTVHAYAYDDKGGEALTTWQVSVATNLPSPTPCTQNKFLFSGINFQTETTTMGNSLVSHCGVNINNDEVVLDFETDSVLEGTTILSQEKYGMGTFAAEVFIPDEPGLLFSFFLYSDIGGKVYETDFEFIPHDSALWVGTFNDWIEADHGFQVNPPYRDRKKITCPSSYWGRWVSLKITKSSSEIAFYLDDESSPIWSTSNAVPKEDQHLMFNVWSPREWEFPNPGAVEVALVQYKIRNVTFTPEGSTQKGTVNLMPMLHLLLN